MGSLVLGTQDLCNIEEAMDGFFDEHQIGNEEIPRAVENPEAEEERGSRLVESLKVLGDFDSI